MLRSEQATTTLFSDETDKLNALPGRSVEALRPPVLLTSQVQSFLSHPPEQARFVSELQPMQDTPPSCPTGKALPALGFVPDAPKECVRIFPSRQPVMPRESSSAAKSQHNIGTFPSSACFHLTLSNFVSYNFKVPSQLLTKSASLRTLFEKRKQEIPSDGGFFS